MINPKQLFLIDGLGAMLSAFLLGIVLVQFENVFGIPRTTLYFLAFLPCLFAVYDFYCYFRVQENLASFLKIIAFVNLGYCFLSLGFAFFHFDKLTYFGWSYILLEIIVVVILVRLELNTAAKINS